MSEMPPPPLDAGAHEREGQGRNGQACGERRRADAKRGGAGGGPDGMRRAVRGQRAGGCPAAVV